jgi:hypothetical protein
LSAGPGPAEFALQVADPDLYFSAGARTTRKGRQTQNKGATTLVVRIINVDLTASVGTMDAVGYQTTECPYTANPVHHMKKHTVLLRNERLQRRLVKLLKARRLAFHIGPDGLVSFDKTLAPRVEKAVWLVRESLFKEWQTVSFPEGWADRYRNYLLKRRIPFLEEVWHYGIQFLIPGSCRPLRWTWIDRCVIEDGIRRAGPGSTTGRHRT